jgi:hypothetical protein
MSSDTKSKMIALELVVLLQMRALRFNIDVLIFKKRSEKTRFNRYQRTNVLIASDHFCTGDHESEFLR